MPNRVNKNNNHLDNIFKVLKSVINRYSWRNQRKKGNKRATEKRISTAVGQWKNLFWKKFYFILEYSWLANLENSAVATGLERLVFIQIPKKGNAKECSNCNTIALISHASMVTFKILQARFQQWRRQWHPTPVLLPGKSHGQRSLVGCSPWGRTESDTTEAT